MSDPNGLIPDVAPTPDGPTAEPQVAGSKKPQENNPLEVENEIVDKKEEEKVLREEEDQKEAEEEEVSSSALLEPSTLPWPGDKDKRPQIDKEDGVCSEKTEERDTEMSRGSQELCDSQTESERKSRDRWRESMPEGERWRDDEVEVHRDRKGDGSLADDEEEEEDEDEESNWISEKAALGFTPQVTIVRPSSKEVPEESRLFIERDVEKEAQLEPEPEAHIYPEWMEEEDDKICEYTPTQHSTTTH